MAKKEKTQTKDITNQNKDKQQWTEVYLGLYERRLIQALEGRFCYPLGDRSLCAKQKLALTEGRKFTGSLKIPIKGAEASISVEYTVMKTREWELGDCDTDEPVVCYDGKVFFWENRSLVAVVPGTTTGIFVVWKSQEQDFGRAMTFLNIVRNDPECNCQQDQQTSFVPFDPGTAFDGDAVLAATISDLRLTGALTNPDALGEIADALESAMFTQGINEPRQVDQLHFIGTQGTSSVLVSGRNCESDPAVAIVSSGQGPCTGRGNAAVRVEEGTPLTVMAVANIRSGLEPRVTVRQTGDPSPMVVPVSRFDGSRLSWLVANIEVESLNGDGEVDVELVGSAGCVQAAAVTSYALTRL